MSAKCTPCLRLATPRDEVHSEHTSACNHAIAIHPVGTSAAGEDDVAVHPGARLMDVLV